MSVTLSRCPPEASSAGWAVYRTGLADGQVHATDVLVASSGVLDSRAPGRALPSFSVDGPGTIFAADRTRRLMLPPGQYRLRTLEQQLNAAEIPDDLKLRLQSYVTACYGSLTSFNVLFADEADQFKGSGGDYLTQNPNDPADLARRRKDLVELESVHAGDPDDPRPGPLDRRGDPVAEPQIDHGRLVTPTAEGGADVVSSARRIDLVNTLADEIEKRGRRTLRARPPTMPL